MRTRCAYLDPRRADRLRNPVVRLYAEYIWGYVAAIKDAPLSPADRKQCYGYLARWLASRVCRWLAVRCVEGPCRFGRNRGARGWDSVYALVAGQEGRDRDRAEIDRQAPAGRGCPRVGLFGHLGACNIGNDASMEAVLRYLRANYPGAVIDAMCPGPERVGEQYGIGAIRMVWYQKYEHRASGAAAVALKMLGRGIDTARIASWVGRHDVVIVPGAGVLEASLPLWPWGMPYSMFLLSGYGRLFRTKVALVSVGAGAINKRATRWLSNAAAGLASYRLTGTRGPGRRCGSGGWTPHGTTFIPILRSLFRPPQTTLAILTSWLSA